MKRLAMALLLCLLLCACGRQEPALPTAAEPQGAELQEETPTIERAAGYVALTFDDGPSPRHTARLLDGLKERGVRATFFLVGYRLADNEALVRRMKAEGHQIGNHSYDHALLTALPQQEALEDLTRCDLALCTLLGEGDYWVRPPYGAVGEDTLSALDVPVVCWSVDPLDWDTTDAARVAAHIVQNAAHGDIILLHDCYASTVDAALQAVDALQAKGLRFVTVAELMAVCGKEAQSGRVTYSGK